MATRCPDTQIDALLHPAGAFDHPRHVVRDPDLTLHEKRAILSSWASDACAVESAPALRQLTRGRVVTFDDILDALRSLDEQTEKADWDQKGDVKRKLRRWSFRSGSGTGGGGLGLQ